MRIWRGRRISKRKKHILFFACRKLVYYFCLYSGACYFFVADENDISDTQTRTVRTNKARHVLRELSCINTLLCESVTAVKPGHVALTPGLSSRGSAEPESVSRQPQSNLQSDLMQTILPGAH